MTEKYIYKGKDITFDVCSKITKTVSIIAERHELPFDDCLVAFYQSSIYKKLQNTETLFWQESAEFLADAYYKEKLTA